jgi:hypothetical protein
VEEPGCDGTQANFTQELDRRQNDVLRQLDQLNTDIEALLAEWTRARGTVS